MGYTLTIDTGERVLSTVKDGAVDDYVAGPYRGSPQAKSFIPSIFDERIQEFLDTRKISSLGDGWKKSETYGLLAESGSREGGTYQVLWGNGNAGQDTFTLASTSEELTHSIKFEHVAQKHFDFAQEFGSMYQPTGPLGMKMDSIEEDISFEAEIGREMLLEGDRYRVTDHGLQEVFD